MKILFILLAILILLLMITVHEFGHYLAGKLLGFDIDEFSIGFGPKLFSRKKKNGEVFSIRLLPLGGYCAFTGETEEEKILATEKIKKEDVFNFEEEKKEANQGDSAVKKLTFNEQKPWKRIIVLIAGGAFNLISAVLFSIIFIAAAGASKPTVSNVYQSVDSAVITSLETGDEIIEIDGYKIDFYHTLGKALDGKKDGDVLDVVVSRNGEKVTLRVPLRKYFYDAKETVDGTETDVRKTATGLGVALQYSKASVKEAFKYCIPYTGELSWSMIGAFGDMITGKVHVTEISGPIGTINQMANFGMQNWRYLLLFLPLIAANLGIFNLLPIPALDGAKVVFTVIEWIRKKPVKREVESMIHFIGLVALLLLVVTVDLIGLFS